MVMELPIELSLDSLTVTQEIDFDGGDDIADILDELDDNDQNVPSVTLNFTSVNELPLGISLNMDFLDASSKSLYSQKNVQLIDAPTLMDGTLVGSTSSNSIVLDSKGIEALKNNQAIQLISKLNTPENEFLPLLETAKVDIYPFDESYKLILKMTMKIHFLTTAVTARLFKFAQYGTSLSFGKCNDAKHRI